MKTISDIKFDENLYCQANPCVLILYQLDRPSIFIPLSYVPLLSFMKMFDDILKCQNHLDKNNRKTFRLLTYSGNIQTWLLDKNTLPDHLEELIIFCPVANEKIFWKRWMSRYTQKVKSIITFDALEREALIFGMNYLEDLFVHFQDDESVLRLLKEDHEKMRLALIACLDKAGAKQDEQIRLGVTAQTS